VPAALKFPTPKQATYQLDSWSGVESLRGDFDKIVAGSAAIVLGQFRAAQTWMNEDTEFGEAWLNYSLDSGGRARNEIRLHIEKQRQGWANQWEFFGKTPNLIEWQRLAHQYERGLWAGHVLAVIKAAEDRGDLSRSVLKHPHASGYGGLADP